jgi:hypothetical protein
VGFFSLVNLGLKDCQDTGDLACSRRGTKRLPLDPTLDRAATGHADAGRGRWMLVKCSYDADTRVYQCVGRNDEQNLSLGATAPVTLKPDEHFVVDSFAILASGRKTFDANLSPTLDWEVGRVRLKVTK